MSQVFISYKTEDRARVKPLVDGLIAEGLSVWWDVHIEGGAAWREVIQAQLDAAACVVVVWSEGSAGPAGRFVQDEASRAARRGVYLPVAIDPVQPPLGFGEHQVLSLVGWRGGRRDSLFLDVAASVRGVIDGGPRPTPRPPRRIRRGLAPGPWFAAGLAAATLAALAGLVAVKSPARLCQATGIGCAGPGGRKPAPANSIAVLPFANLSGDPAQDYFSDGLSEELLGKLARLEQLLVAARTSSFKFKGSGEDSAAIGAKLGVAYILDGSVRRDGPMVRVSAQLVEAKSGFERWSQTYDREMKDIFAVQSGIAEAVARALQVKLLGGDIAALSRSGTTNPAAYDAFLRGRRLFDATAGESSYRGALAQFDAAIAADPRFAAAHAARARALVAIGNQFAAAGQVRATYDAALKSARRAVELAPDLAQAQSTLAVALASATLDFSVVKAAYARALATGGGDADVLTGYGQFACLAGDFGPGLAALRRAATLDPLNPRVYKTLGLGLIAARQYPAAIDAMRRALALSPGINGAHAAIGEALMLQGRLEEAKAEYALEPEGYERFTGQAIVLRKLGDAAGAQAAVNALIADGADASAYQLAQVRAQWGDRDGAIAMLDTAFKFGDSGLLVLKSDPLMDPVRGDPRFPSRLARLGLGA